MSNIIVYQEEKLSLGEVSFVKDIPNQIKIREVSGYELTKQISLILPQIIVHLGIKGQLPDFTKTDIKEMILLRFKSLSLNEVAYAFKLERYGILGVKTEHYQLFDATYVSAVLEKYVTWKKLTKLTHNIEVSKPVEVKVSDQEKIYWNNQGINTCLDHFLDTKTIKYGYLYVYEILYDKGLLPTDKETKLKVKNAAIELLKTEYATKKAVTLEEKRDFNRLLSQLQEKNDKRDAKNVAVINKCKELSIINFFRKLIREDKIAEFKAEFKNIELKK